MPQILFIGTIPADGLVHHRAIHRRHARRGEELDAAGAEPRQHFRVAAEPAAGEKP